MSLYFSPLFLILCRQIQPFQSLSSYLHCLFGLLLIHAPSTIPNTTCLINLVLAVLQFCPNKLNFLSIVCWMMFFWWTALFFTLLYLISSAMILSVGSFCGMSSQLPAIYTIAIRTIFRWNFNCLWNFECFWGLLHTQGPPIQNFNIIWISASAVQPFRPRGPHKT